MPAPVDLAALFALAAALVGTAMGVGFAVRGAAWGPWRWVVMLHGGLGAAALVAIAWVVGFGAATRTEPEGGVSFGVLGLAFLVVAAVAGITGDRVSRRRPGVRGFVLTGHAMLAVFGMALVITAALTTPG